VILVILVILVMFLLDTTTLIYLFKQQGRVAAHLQSHLAREVFIPSIVLFEVAGTPIGPCDLFIAGIALANDMTLITRNTCEFERVPGLRVENWYL